MQNGQAVETAEITVQYVNDPKPGKKWGSIKTTDGQYYSGPPAVLKLFQPGETCKIDFTLGGNDGTLKAVKRKHEVPPALQRPVAPAPRARTNPSDSEQIFVTAIVKHIATADMGRDEGKALVNLWRSVYADTFGSPAKQQINSEFNDEIPY